MSQFIVSEACEIDFQKNAKGVKYIFKEHVKAFWENYEKYSKKNGCYIFAIRNRGLIPYYVGRSSRQFFKEVFHSDKREKYNGVLHSNTHGTPVIFFITPAKSQEKISPSKLAQLEAYLIQSAFRSNKKLVNIHGTARPAWTIKGITEVSKGKPKENDKVFISMLKIQQW